MSLLRINFVIVACLLSHAAFALPTVTVMADSDLSVAVAEIARDYSRDHGIIVSTSFVAPNVQQAQIAEGAAADILITPKQAWIETMKTQGLIDVHSQTPVADNQLVLAGPADSVLEVGEKHGQYRFPAAALIQKLDGESGFVVANPETLAEGMYSKQALRKLGVAGDLEPYTLYIKQRDQMFDMVANHRAYGLFFYSSVIGKEGIRIIGPLPESAHTPIRYYAVVIAGDNMDEARKFLQYLTTPEAKKVFEDNGLLAD